MLITAAAAGLWLGGQSGAAYGLRSGDPSDNVLFTQVSATAVMSVGAVLLAGLLGLILSAFESSSRLGKWILLATGFFVVGFPVGVAVGPKPVVALVSVGHVRVELAEPVGQVLEATATCSSFSNDTRILSITANPLGRVGVDLLRLKVSLSRATGVEATVDNTPTIEIGVDSSWGYQGFDASRTVEVSADRRTGRATFSDLHATSDRLGGPSGLETISGSIAWDCEPPTPRPTPGTPGAPNEEADFLSGWFWLDGIVTVDRDAPGVTGHRPGRAFSGECSPASPFRTRVIETVVPWLGGQRARLSLVPERTHATLTIDLGDGSTPETVTAPATVVEGSPDNILTAVFHTRAGRLELRVEWSCG